MIEHRGHAAGGNLMIAVVVASYNATVTDGLLEGALEVLKEAELKERNTIVVRVPGALELPVAAAQLARTAEFDALVCLGAVIKGETDHYQHVSEQSIGALARLSAETCVPIGIGVLTCETLALARDRSTTAAKNKGAEAARTALELANLLDDLRGSYGS